MIDYDHSVYYRNIFRLSPKVIIGMGARNIGLRMSE
jgi:hypothetical protein